MRDLFNEPALALPFVLPADDGYSAWRNEEYDGWNIEFPNGRAFYAENFFSKKVSDRTFEYLQESDSIDWRTIDWRGIAPDDLEKIAFKNINWKQDWINFFGKRNPLPRLTSWYGDSGKTYTYSGIKSKPNEWNKGLLYIKEAIEECIGERFNSVLLNWYRDGSDSLSWHSDNEKELGVDPTIASASFGATRDFLVRRKDDNSKRLAFKLKHGSLLVMMGEMQRFWEHAIPKRKSLMQSRFNLTFRQID